LLFCLAWNVQLSIHYVNLLSGEFKRHRRTKAIPPWRYAIDAVEKSRSAAQI
jgi:hypothetical protein